MPKKNSVHKRINIEHIFRRKGRTLKRNKSSLFVHSLDFTRRIKKEFPRSIVLIFVGVFIITSLGASYILSGGQPIFGPNIAGVSKHDLIYKMYLADEEKANIMGPKGGPAVSTLKIFTYTISKDDNLSKIAHKTGVTLDSLISLNSLQDAHMLRVGKQLIIPNQKGIYYRVRKGDSLGKIAKKYKIKMDTIKGANAIFKEDLAKGMVIFLPGARLSSRVMDKALGMLFRRPAIGGWLSSGFGYRRNPFGWRHQFHSGVDIALPYWTPIRSVRRGQVMFRGWRGGYGKLVVVRHSNGYRTFYGHMIKYIVRPWQWVRAGQVIGYVGSTGNSTGPHLHFEIHRWGRLLNPFAVRGFRRAFRRGY